MIVRFIPTILTRNPYLELLATALAEQGVAVHRASFRYLTPAWLFRHRRDVHVIHLHWFHNYHRAIRSCRRLAPPTSPRCPLARQPAMASSDIHNLQPTSATTRASTTG